MNNERYNQIIHEVWKKHALRLGLMIPRVDDDNDWQKSIPQTKNELIEKIKIGEWGVYGLKIEERELSWEKRFELFKEQNNGSHPEDIEMLDDYDIPTKLLTIIYNNETIEVYE
jgi:hypothetical protein